MAGAYLKLNRDDIISISTSPGFADFDRYLDSISQRAGSLKPAFEIAGQVIVTSVRKNFIEQGRPSTWAPLSKATKFSIIGGSKGLKKSGDLKRSARRKLADRKVLIDRGMAGGLMGSINFRANSGAVRVGTPKIYGAVHQYGINKIVSVKRHSKTVFGTQSKAIRPGTMHMQIPARTFLDIQDEDWPAIKDAFIRYLTKV